MKLPQILTKYESKYIGFAIKPKGVTQLTFRINSSTEQIYHEGVNCDISIYHCFSLIYICKCVKVRSNCQIREMAAKILQQIGLSSIHGVGNPQGNSLYMTLY